MWRLSNIFLFEVSITELKSNNKYGLKYNHSLYKFYQSPKEYKSQIKHSKHNTNIIIMYIIYWEQKIPKQKHNFPKWNYYLKLFVGYIIPLDIALDQRQRAHDNWS